MRIELRNVTPEMAKSWMQRNADCQRRINPRTVDMLAADIRGGNWKLTHQGIAFDGGGRLIDGQHRLMAIIQANTPVRMYVATNVDRDAFAAIDSGRARTVRESAQMMFDEGDLRRDGDAHALAKGIKTLITKEWSTNAKYSKTETYAAVEEYMGAIAEGIWWRHHIPKLKKVGVLCAIMAAIISGESRDAVESFLKCACQNDFSMSAKYNCKAAIEARDTPASNGGGSAAKHDYDVFRKGIYLFVHNVKYKKNKTFYEISPSEFRIWNDQLTEKMENGGNRLSPMRMVMN